MSAEAPAEASNITGAGKGVKRPPESDDTTKKDGEKGDDSESLTSFPAAKIARTSTDPTKKTPTPSAGERPADDSTAESVDGKGVTRQPTDSDRVEEEALREIDLNIGDRLEVMWLLEEEDKSTEKWWGCSVTGPVKGERDESGVPVFTLHYDAFEAFEEADHNVTFVDKYRLIHLEDGAEMTWKKEGHEVDREALMASLADEDVDLQEMVREQEQDEEEAGDESTESRGMRELARLPFHQQIAMAEGFRRMTDVVKEHLRAKMAQQGGGQVVVSAEDVQNMFREVRAGGPGEPGV